MESAISRRALLAAAGEAVAAIGLAALSLALPGCSLPDGERLEQRLIEALQRLPGDRRGAATIAGASGMVPQGALRTLRADVSDRHLFAVTSHGFFLRAFLDGRRDADFAGGRTRWVEGWLLSDTEVAMAVLLGR